MASGLHKELTRQYSESLAREDGREVREPPAPLEFWIAEHNAERVARGEHERGYSGPCRRWGRSAGQVRPSRASAREVRVNLRKI